jgi:hypothetical protein
VRRNTSTLRRALCLLLLAAPAALAAGRQIVDPAFDPRIERPAYPPGEGPLVRIDRGHHTFHADDGAFAQLAGLLRRDGYRVDATREPFTAAALERGRILIVVNALANADPADWVAPTPPAFTAAEVAAVHSWVHAGGSLLFVVDHMPMPGAAEALGRAFGVELMNGFALVEAEWDPLVFRRSDGTLRPHPIADGRDARERVDSVMTFVSGSAFRALDDGVRPLLVFGPDVVSINTQRAWIFDEKTPRVPVTGWLQGATLEPGAGRVAIFGESAMFAAQLVGPKRNRVGMNHPRAGGNLQFLLNTMRWLSRAP